MASKSFLILRYLSSYFQSASISEDLARVADESAKALKKNKPDFEMNFFAHVKSGDFVSRTGGYLFANIDPKIVQVSLDIARPLDNEIAVIQPAKKY